MSKKIKLADKNLIKTINNKIGKVISGKSSYKKEGISFKAAKWVTCAKACCRSIWTVDLKNNKSKCLDCGGKVVDYHGG